MILKLMRKVKVRDIWEEFDVCGVWSIESGWDFWERISKEERVKKWVLGRGFFLFLEDRKRSLVSERFRKMIRKVKEFR